MRSLRAGLSCALLLVVSACASSEPGIQQGSGVNDIRKACDVRGTWKNLQAARCVDCVSGAPLPTCGCPEFKDFAGRCEAQGQRSTGEADCTQDLNICVQTRCQRQDCACIDACYQGHDACRGAHAARDGCVVEVCATHCQ